MKPTFTEGERILVLRLNRFSKVRAGDIVVIYKNGMEMIKRIRRIESAERIYVQGDNSAESTDGLDFGAITKKEIIGKVVFRY